MGLDGVELILAFEDEFQIEISDAQAESMRTVGDSVDIIYELIKNRISNTYFSDRSFYQVRKVLVEMFGLPEIAVQLDVKLEDVIPLKNRANLWESTQKNLGAINLIYTDFPKWLTNVMFYISFAILVFVVFFFFSSIGWWSVLAALICAIANHVILARIFRFKRTIFPDECKLVSDLVNVVPLNKGEILTKEEVIAKVKIIACSVLGLKPEQIKLEARWINDLGVD